MIEAQNGFIDAARKLVRQQRVCLLHFAQMRRDKSVVKEHVAERRNRRRRQRMARGNGADGVHHLGKLTGKAEGDREVAELRLHRAQPLHAEAAEGLTAHKGVARHNGGGLYAAALKGGEHLVGAVAHAVEYNGLAAVAERLPHAALVLKKFKHGHSSPGCQDKS